MSTQRRRVERVRTSLTPRQAVLAWLREAHASPDPVAYVRPLIGKPVNSYPLQRLGAQVDTATRTALRGQGRERIEAGVRQALRETSFLWQLCWDLNGKVLAAEQTLQLRRAHLVELLRTLLHYDHLAASLDLLREELSVALPYPLNADTAAAVQAARQQAVMTWDTLDDLDTIAAWVLAQYEREGHVRLPVGAYLAVLDPAGMRWPSLPRPDPAVVRACFADAAGYAAFVADEAYHHDLADVPDADVEARQAAVEAALRALVASGAVAAGAIVSLPTVPHSYLREAPLADGVWLDRTTLALAEWGVVLARQGCAVREPLDDHPLAWDRIAPAASGPSPAALRSQADARLQRFAGRSRLIDGCLYLHLGDYDRWRGRGVKRRLLPTAQPGFSVAAWNAWVGAQGGDGGAALAGVGVGPLEAYAEDAPFVACGDDGLAQRLATRERWLETLASWSLSESGGADGRYTRALPGDRRSFRDLAETWRNAALEYLSDLYTLEGCALAVSERYMAGQEVLFPEPRAILTRLVQDAEALVGVFNEAAAAPLDVAARRGRDRYEAGLASADAPREWALGPLVVRTCCAPRVQVALRFLIDHATARTLKDAGEDEAAHRLMERHLRDE